jgi:hypothetical protein
MAVLLVSWFRNYSIHTTFACNGQRKAYATTMSHLHVTETMMPMVFCNHEGVFSTTLPIIPPREVITYMTCCSTSQIDSFTTL